MRKIFVIIIFFLSSNILLFSINLKIEDTINFKKYYLNYQQKKNHDKPGTTPIFSKCFVNCFSATIYTGSLLGLGTIWYKDKATSNFHLFNDIEEWKGVDKVGHATTAFQIAQIQTELYKSAGYTQKKSTLVGATCSFAYLSAIEIFDGFSGGWGFSLSDFAANSLGLGLFFINKEIIKKDIFNLKYSFHYTKYAKLNPSLLGDNWLKQPLKDYNGQTYWLSINIKDCFFCNKNFPSWLNIALGYGADGMIGARKNPSQTNGVLSNNRISQWYLAPDIDFSKIPTNKKGLKLFFKCLNFIKIPAPTLEYNSNNVLKFHFFYF